MKFKGQKRRIKIQKEAKLKDELVEVINKELQELWQVKGPFKWADTLADAILTHLKDKVRIDEENMRRILVENPLISKENIDNVLKVMSQSKDLITWG